MKKIISAVLLIFILESCANRMTEPRTDLPAVTAFRPSPPAWLKGNWYSKECCKKNTSWQIGTDSMRIHCPKYALEISDLNLCRDSVTEVSNEDLYLLSFPGYKFKFFNSGDSVVYISNVTEFQLKLFKE